MENKKKFSRSIKELENIFNFLEGNGEKFHLGERLLHDIELSVEEIFTNMVRHNSGSSQAIEISIESVNGQILTCLTDHEEHPFDLTKTTKIDFDDYIKKKRSGGLGIFLVKQLMDEVKFEHQNGISKITIIKNV
ncbi:MAG: ATP-binding protein [Balneolaceae bacterium]|nr:ATP-binding protein [Balneolaceae bacterium]